MNAKNKIPLLIAFLVVTAISLSLNISAQERKADPSHIKPFDDVWNMDLTKSDPAAIESILATLSFNGKTIWPNGSLKTAAMKILKDGLNPGLGVRDLHSEGLTGQGVAVAIIDQPLISDHPEYAGKIVAYKDMGCDGEISSYHGPSVASLLAGTNNGTAPGVKIYYAAVPMWKGDTSYEAQALDWIVEENRKLPKGGKIRVVSVSAAPSGEGAPRKVNKEMWDVSCAQAEKEGILVLDCTRHRGIIAPSWHEGPDAEAVAKYKPGYPGLHDYRILPGRILVPASPRTCAEEYVKGEFGYRYDGRGGLSWAIPYCAGILALGWQECPDMTSSLVVDLLFKSAFKADDGMSYIHPGEFIRLVRRYKKEHSSLSRN